MQEHIKVVHEKIPLLECEDCGEQFTVKRNLKRHIKDQHNIVNFNFDFSTDEDFACDTCELIVKRKDNFNQHKETTHRDTAAQNSYECSHCDKTYLQPDALKRHKK